MSFHHRKLLPSPLYMLDQSQTDVETGHYEEEINKNTHKANKKLATHLELFRMRKQKS